MHKNGKLHKSEIIVYEGDCNYDFPLRALNYDGIFFGLTAYTTVWIVREQQGRILKFVGACSASEVKEKKQSAADLVNGLKIASLAPKVEISFKLLNTECKVYRSA